MVTRLIILDVVPSDYVQNKPSTLVPFSVLDVKKEKEFFYFEIFQRWNLYSFTFVLSHLLFVHVHAVFDNSVFSPLEHAVTDVVVQRIIFL